MQPTLASRRGMSLVELLLAGSILALTMAAVASLGTAAQSAAEYAGGHGEAAEQARLITARIARAVEGAAANEKFPGFLVVANTVDGLRYPDALVVWRPNGGAADPQGLPRKGELVIYAPHPIYVNTLLELTMPGDAATVPEVSETAAWQSLLLTAQLGDASKQVVLTRQLRVCTTDGSDLPLGYNPKRRGAVRFESRLRPSQQQWEACVDGDLDWDRIDWAQTIQSTETGLRQAWVRFELQIMPDITEGAEAIPFFGSASLYYEMKRPENL